MTVMVSPTLLPDFLPRAAQSFTSRPLDIGDVVCIIWGQLHRHYRITEVHENGECDLTAEDAQ